MNDQSRYMTHLLESIVELLDIPASYYVKAADRYKSLGEWLCREESKVARYSPVVYPQGSFRYGTVIRPLFKTDEYDLDLVCQLLLLAKASLTQRQLKHLIGDEIKLYARHYNILKPVEEKPRCWRLDYADHVSFHMDILPCIPEDRIVIESLCRLGVLINLAATAVAITDNRFPNYFLIDTHWPSSNPQGFAKWFERIMREVAQPIILKRVAERAYASVEEVPPYEWKTPLQRSIQILKRHRDVIFKDDSRWQPISMIITTLSAHAYEGETNLYEALSNIVDKMPNFVRKTEPRIPNPVNPAEDFADKWKTDQRYEDNFWAWHLQVKTDLQSLRLLNKKTHITNNVRERFSVVLTDEMKQRLPIAQAYAAPAVISSRVHISSPPKPWGDNT